MAIPETIFEIIDQSARNVVNTTVQNVSPLQLIAFASDKGIEDLTEITSYEQFMNTYVNNNTVDFNKYGQPLLQAARYSYNGGRLLAKRIVAKDATLGNALVIAKVKTTSGVPATDSSGNQLYIDYNTGEETIIDKVQKLDENGNALYYIDSTIMDADTGKIKEEGNTTTSKVSGGTTNDPVMVDNAKADTVSNVDITYDIKSISGITDITKAMSTAKLYVENLTQNNSDINILTTYSDIEEGEVDPWENEDNPPTSSGDNENPKDPETPSTGDSVEKIYPLFFIYDTGRGASNKRFRVEPDYTGSRYMNWFKYKLTISENSKDIDTFTFSLDPTFVDQNNMVRSLEISASNSFQIRVKIFEDETIDFINDIAEALVIDANKLVNENDILFGKTKKQKKLNNLTSHGTNLNDDGINLAHTFGHALNNGTYGSFGSGTENVTNNKDYQNLLVEFFSGNTDKHVLFDVDKYKIDCIFDANYPLPAKQKIVKLTDFRNDGFFFRDMGTNHTTLEEIKSLYIAGDGDNEYSRSRNVSTNHLYYDIRDPYTRKQITVTYTYSLSQKFISHFKNGVSKPFAGIQYGITIPEAIEGTVNFIPIKYPENYIGVNGSANEKQELDDLRINYAAYYNNVLVIETLYTSQNEDTLTELSYSNNVLLIHDIIKAIRNKCPSIRYSFITGDDFSIYQNEVNKVLDAYKDQFRSINLVYLGDDDYIANKIYYASISVQFKQFVQTEYFKIYALS